MPTYRMMIEYDGSDFCGWQVQEDDPSVQAALEAALATALRTRVNVVGSGRTDSGVHARGQVAHFMTSKHVDVFRLLGSVNGLLPRSIAVRTLEEAPDGFHARYDARWRSYHYYVTTGFRALDRHLRWRIRPETDFDRMNTAAADLLGERNFDSFCKTQSETEMRVCTVRAAHWVSESVPGDWRFEITANRFLHGMVRAIVGTLVEIGHGKRPPDDIPRILAVKDRREAGPAAPAFGLVLERVSYAVLAALVVLGLAACQRPFVELRNPTLEVVSPEFSTIFPNTKIELAVRATAYHNVERVEVNGDTLIYDEQSELWIRDFALHNGLNQLVFVVTDSDDQSVRDTVYAMHGSLEVDRTVPSLPGPRGGHTATRLNDRTIVVIGGSTGTPADALSSAARWTPGENAFRTMIDQLYVARTGHSATLLPDGRILILGGSRGEPPDGIGDMVEIVEILDPITESIQVVPFSGAPIRRAYHTASLQVEGDDIFVDLYGGLGDIRYRPESDFGTRRDLRRFVFRNDSLIAVSPAPGPSLDHAIWGHTQTALNVTNSGEPGRFLIAGTFYGRFDPENVSFILDYASPTGIAQIPTGELLYARVRHASVMLSDGFVATFGGYRDSPDNALNVVEVYAEPAGRHFAFPETISLVRRYGMTATKLPGRRILVSGGFLSSGQGLSTNTVFDVPFF